MNMLIGENLDVEECFQLAKQRAMNYVGLQRGRECWASNDYGHHGELDDT
jgi:hypothetical protein